MKNINLTNNYKQAVFVESGSRFGCVQDMKSGVQIKEQASLYHNLDAKSFFECLDQNKTNGNHRIVCGTGHTTKLGFPRFRAPPHYQG